jgi:predicted chitinase
MRARPKIFNHVYCNRMGNGDEASGEAEIPRPRLHPTRSRDNREIGKKIGVDIEANPT